MDSIQATMCKIIYKKKFTVYEAHYFLFVISLINSKETISRNSEENSWFWRFLADRIFIWLCLRCRQNNNLQTNLIFSPHIFKIHHFNLYLKWIISIFLFPFTMKSFWNWNCFKWACNSFQKPTFNKLVLGKWRGLLKLQHFLLISIV